MFQNIRISFQRLCRFKFCM